MLACARAARWSASCIMPKMSTSSSAGPCETSMSERRSSCSTQDPPCGLGYSRTRIPGRTYPCAAASLTADSACSTSALGSRPRGSSGVVGSLSSWTSRQSRHITMTSGYSGSGSGSDGWGWRSDGGWNPASSTRTPWWLSHQRHDHAGSAEASEPLAPSGCFVAWIITLLRGR